MITIAFMGDTICQARDGGDPFARVRSAISDANLRMLNLETVLTDSPPTAKKHVRLTTPTANARYLTDARIDVAHIDNNHTMDAGIPSREEMIGTLVRAGAAVIDRELRYVHLPNGIAVCGGRLFAIDPAGQDRILRDLRGISTMARIRVVSLHWGEEHMPYPSPEQIKFAHKLIDAGATVVVGHHPHCLQGVERYGKGLIAYSLGNFNFWHGDVRPSWHTRLGMVLRVYCNERGVQSWRAVPTWIDEDWRPWLCTRRGDALILLDKLSAGIGQQTERQWYNLLGWQYVTQTVRSSLLAAKRHGIEPLRRLRHWLTLEHARKAIAGTLRAGPVDRWKGLHL